MNSPHEVLGISSNSTMEQIEAAFQEKSEYWRRLQANPKRSAEASAMVEQVIVAYETLRAQSQSAASGLEYREPRSFGGQVEVASVDKDSCPHCGHKGNPPNARFCLGCGEKLFQVCPNPNCQTELPWHYERCHQCGTNIEDARQEQVRQQRLKEIELFQEREQKLEEINRQLVSLAAIESRIRFWGLRDALSNLSGPSEITQWSQKENTGCGTQLARLALGGAGLFLFAIAYGVIASLFPTDPVPGSILIVMSGLLTIMAIMTTRVSVIDKPRALEAIGKERMKLELEKRELAHAAR